MEFTEGHLLGGRVRYCQPARGFRSGIEPVLLAATVPARPGETVLEAGSGAGAGLLCLAARVPGIVGVGVERDPALADLAAHNARANGSPALTFVEADIRGFVSTQPADHVFANPPYHSAEGTASPDPVRAFAKQAEADVFRVWTSALASSLRPKGTMTLIGPAARLADCIAALSLAHCGSAALYPLWPREDSAAKLVLLQAVKLGRGPFRVLPGLVLHEASGAYTRRAEAVLRHGAAIRI